jgi:hypothetical protein
MDLRLAFGIDQQNWHMLCNSSRARGQPVAAD